MFTSNELSAYLLMWTLVIWVSGHNQVSKGWHIAALYATIGRGKSIMQSITMSLATLKNPALMLSAVIRGLGRIPTKTEYAYTSKCYYMLESIKGMSIQDSLLYLENVESVIAELWKLESDLPSRKGDNQKAERIGMYAELIRAEYAESGKIPAWVDSLLASGKLGDIETQKTAKGRKSNKVETIAPIGAAIVTYEDSENESDGASPAIPNRMYSIGGLKILAKSISNAQGKQGTQIFQCDDSLLLARLKPAKSIVEIDGISGYTWHVAAKDTDNGKVYMTWHKVAAPAAKATTAPAAKAKASAKAKATTAPAPAAKDNTQDIAAIVAAVLAAMGKA